MTISLCMIVRDEEAVLERCLEPARPHVDEIVIVDTGSTDGTLDIARKYADVLVEIEWPDSFSEARNVSLDHATSDLVLILDADEYIPEEAHWDLIKEAIAYPDLLIGQLSVINTLSNSITDAQKNWMPRIFPNHDSIRYDGRVHNQIEENIVAYGKTRFEEKGQEPLGVYIPAHVIHTGYDLPEDEMRKKYQTRVDLIKTQIEESEDRTKEYYKFQLGSLYHIIKEYAKACKVWPVVDFDKLDPSNAFYAHYVASQCYRRLKQHDKAIKHAQMMPFIIHREPIGFYQLGALVYESGRPREGMLLIIESYIKSFVETGCRYALNKKLLLRDTSIGFRCLDMGDVADRIEGLDPEKAIKELTECQKSLVQLDDIDEYLTEPSQ